MWKSGNGNQAVEDIVSDCSRRKLQGEMKNIIKLIRDILECINILDISLKILAVSIFKYYIIQ